MTLPRSLSCPLCLEADEPAVMVDVEISRPRLKQIAHVHICRSCAFTIAKAVRKTGELPPPQEVANA